VQNKSPDKKLPQEIGLEDLYAALERDEETFTYKNDTLLFIATFDLRPGKFIISKHAMYQLYRKWSRNPVSKIVFSLELQKFLPVTSRYYQLSLSPLKITESIYKRVLDHTVDKTKSPRFKQHFDSFLEFYDIRAGKYYHKASLLYFFYDKWAYKNRNRNPLSYVQFNNFLKVYFSQKTLGSDYAKCFGINKRIVTTSEEQEKAKAWSEKYNGRTNKTKKRKSKIES
jgi:hypothetical protein